MAKRRAKRIADRKVKDQISEEEKPVLTLIANIIAQIAIREMDRDEEIASNNDSSYKSSSSSIKTKKKKLRLK